MPVHYISAVFIPFGGMNGGIVEHRNTPTSTEGKAVSELPGVSLFNSGIDFRKVEVMATTHDLIEFFINEPQRWRLQKERDSLFELLVENSGSPWADVGFKVFQATGLPPKELRSLTDLEQLPFLQKTAVYFGLSLNDQQSQSSSVAEIGPFVPEWLRVMFDVEDNRTLKDRLENRQRVETQRKWHVPLSCLDALDDWKKCLRDASKNKLQKHKKQIELFLSLH